MAAAVAALAVPAVALAHANLLRAEPADGSTVRAGPAAVRLFFDDTIRAEPGMRAVRNSGGSVLAGRPRVVGGRELVLPLRPGLRRGAYTVLWRVLADDGHPVAGVTTFAVGAGQPRPQPVLKAPSQQELLPGFERWVFLSGILLAVGLAAFRIRMPREAAPSLWLLAAAFALAAAGGAALVAQASLSTRFGIVAAVAVGVALVGVAAALAARLLPRLATAAWACALALVVMPSTAGHALDPGRSRLEFPVDVLHVAASSIWFGGLVALVVAAQRGALRGYVLRRFSSLALISVALIAATGLVRALSELSSVGQVWGTSYGRWLIVKTGFFAVLVGLGWMNRYRLLPSLVRSTSDVRRNLRAEVLLLLGLVAAVAVLTESRPGRDHLLAAPVAAAAPARPVPKSPEEAVVLSENKAGFELAGEAANAFSLDSRSVVWETVAGEDGGTAVLDERDLALGRTRTLAHKVAPLYGLAATPTSIVYATASTPPAARRDRPRHRP